LYPFIHSWKSITYIIDDMCNNVIVVYNETPKWFKFSSLSDYKEGFTREKIDKFDKIMDHLQNMIFLRATAIKYTFIFAWGSSKFISFCFSVFALFIDVEVTPEIIQLIFLVVMLEIAVTRFLLLPASICTNRSTWIVVGMLEVEKDISQFLLFPPEDITKDELRDLKHTLSYFSSKMRYWQTQAQLGFLGYWFRIEMLFTSWGIGASDLRASVFTFLFTIIPALITFFVKHIKYSF
jgi:hypothetical protein